MTTIYILGVIMLLYVLNPDQIVHRTPNPNWIERLGRKNKGK